MANGETREQALDRHKKAGRGLRYQPVYEADLCCPVVLSLSPSQRWLWMRLTVLCPPYGKQISRQALAEMANLDPSTLRRNLAVLYELGLARVEGTGGGAHENINRYFAIRPDPEAPPRKGSRMWKRWIAAGRIPAESREPVADRPPEGAKLTDEQEPDHGAVGPSPGPVTTEDFGLRELSDAERLEVLQAFPDEALEAVIELLQPGVAQPTDRRSELWDWADAAGVNRPGPATPPVDPAAPSDARGMVAAFRKSWSLQAPPQRVELSIATGLIKNHGPAQAWTLLCTANGRLTDLRRRGVGQDPVSMRYLEPHLAKVGARWSIEVDRPPD